MILASIAALLPTADTRPKGLVSCCLVVKICGHRACSAVDSVPLWEHLIADQRDTIARREERGQLFGAGLATVVVDRHLIVAGLGDERRARPAGA